MKKVDECDSAICFNQGYKNFQGYVLLYAIHFRTYDQYNKTEPTYAQYYSLFIKLCLLVLQHISANNYINTPLMKA
jgi:hypothetical protein